MSTKKSTDSPRRAYWNPVPAAWEGFRQSISGLDSSHQIATGVVLGMLVGLLPKDSALPYLFAVALVLSLSNLLAGLVSALVFGGIGLTLDAVTHPLGLWALSSPLCPPVFGQLNEWHLFAWTRLNNTVVMGNLLLGLALVYPLYALTHALYRKARPWLEKSFSKHGLTRWMLDDASGR